MPDGMVDKVVDGVKAKIAGDKLSDAVGSLKKLFQKAVFYWTEFGIYRSQSFCYKRSDTHGYVSKENTS